MAYIRKKFINHEIEQKRKDRNSTMLAFDNFRTFQFNPFFNKFNEKGLQLLKDYAEKVAKDTCFNEVTLNYAENILKFLKSWDTGKLDTKAGAELEKSNNEWQLFCCGALRTIGKEYLFYSLC